MRKINKIWLYLILSIIVVSSSYAYSVSLSNYVSNTLSSHYSSDREYASCLNAQFYDGSYHAFSFGNNVLSKDYLDSKDVSYKDNFFYGSRFSTWSWCNTPIQVHSHPNDLGDSCYPSSTDLDGWKNFTSVKVFLIQCATNKFMVYYKSDLNKGVVNGYEYKI